MQASEFSREGEKPPGRIWPSSLFPRETQQAAHSCLSWWMGRVKTFVCSVLSLPAYPERGGTTHDSGVTPLSKTLSEIAHHVQY